MEVSLKRKRCDSEFKLSVVEYYNSLKGSGITSRDIAERFGISSHTSVLEWESQQEQLRGQFKTSKKIKPDSFSMYPDLEMELLHWFIALRNKACKYFLQP